MTIYEVKFHVIKFFMILSGESPDPTRVASNW